QIIDLPPAAAIPLSKTINLPVAFQDLRENLPDSFVIIMIMILTWRAAFNLARYQGIQNGVYGQLKLGIFMFVFFALFTLFFGGDLPFLSLASFSFFTLMAMATSRLALVGYSRGGAKIPFSFQWLGGLTTTALMTIIFALGLGLVFGRDTGRGILSLFGGVAKVFYSIIGFIFLPVLMLVEWWVGDDQVAPEILDQTRLYEGIIFGPSATPDSISDFGGREIVYPIIIWASVLIAVFVIIAGVRKVVKSNRIKNMVNEGDEVSQTSLVEAFRTVIKNPLKAFQEGLESLREKYLDNLLASVRIRRIYAKFLNLCIDLDIPRKKAQTPLEFIVVAQEKLSTLNPEMVTITNAYMKVRYGGMPEEDSDIQDVEIAWKTIQEEAKLI
ncbi:MAG: DUF4129 domain-containing protein, partial [Chloroflexi bacterium]|nr:DUF4129 domain-containing protein [Chloroflexota bacterium]